MVNTIPTASEANKLTHESIGSCNTKQLLTLCELIRKAIANGEFSVTLAENLQPVTEQKLKELGYEVKLDSVYHELMFHVSWKDTK